MLHRRHTLAAPVRRLARGLMADELLAGDGMLALGESLEVLFPDCSGETPADGKVAIPHAANHVAFRVVVLARVLKLFLVVAARLARAQRLGDRQHRAAVTGRMVPARLARMPAARVR